MGAAQTSVSRRRLRIIGFALAALTVPAKAQADSKCTGRTSLNKPFAVCFDVGNRLYLDAGSAGFGAGLHLRHAIGFSDEPDLTWKLDHQILGFAILFNSPSYISMPQYS